MTDYPGVAVITGAASGIGRATAIAFARRGCSKIALLDRNEAGLAESQRLVLQSYSDPAAAAATAKVLTFAIDVTQPDSVASTYAAVHAALQRIDYAVQCAGVITFDAPSADCALETFDRDNAINYRGLWLCTREAIRLMRRQGLDCDAYPHAGIPAYRAQRGAIVNLSSGMALRHQRNCSVYSASKAAVLALSRGDGVDYAADRIRVNAVLPGLVDSPMTAAVDAERRKFLEDRVRDVVPSKRFGRPEEIADVCLFLVSTQASYVTAAAWSVDGGRGGV